jgi:hypothetical protein
MRQRPVMKLHPVLERFEEKRLLSAGPLRTPFAELRAAAESRALQSEDSPRRRRSTPPIEFILNRITQPTPTNAILVPPFGQVLVQNATPVPGEVYNILSVSLRNSTKRTFDASSGFEAKVTGQHSSVPVLTGTEQWKPGEVFVFYILTKRYYPLRPITGAGFQFNFASGIAIPGPSGIFLRIRYNPATFADSLNRIIVAGPGAKGHTLGLPDTAIWEFLPRNANIIPL